MTEGLSLEHFEESRRQIDPRPTIVNAEFGDESSEPDFESPYVPVTLPEEDLKVDAATKEKEETSFEREIRERQISQHANYEIERSGFQARLDVLRERADNYKKAGMSPHELEESNRELKDTEHFAKYITQMI
jgi:hypothetical protein